MQAEIYVVGHKKAIVPSEGCYLPVQVGNNSQDFFAVRDNQGVNISSKNANYCELTAQFWAWKNRNVDIKGLVHYRRYFVLPGTTRRTIAKSSLNNSVLPESQILQDFSSGIDVILPKKRNYYIETLWSHYEHSHKIEALQITREIISEKMPEALSAFDKVMSRRKAHMFNMIIAKSALFDEYSEWLFSILFELEARLDISSYDAVEARVFGYVSELLLDVWLEGHPELHTKEYPVLFTEKQNWIKKGGSFLIRKVQAK